MVDRGILCPHCAIAHPLLYAQSLNDDLPDLWHRDLMDIKILRFIFVISLVLFYGLILFIAVIWFGWPAVLAYHVLLRAGPACYARWRK